MLTMKLMTPQIVQTFLFGHGVLQIQASLAYVVDMGNIKQSREFKSSVIDVFLLFQCSVFLKLCCYKLAFISICMFANLHGYFYGSSFTFKEVHKVCIVSDKKSIKKTKTLKGSCAHK